MKIVRDNDPGGEYVNKVERVTVTTLWKLIVALSVGVATFSACASITLPEHHFFFLSLTLASVFVSVFAVIKGNLFGNESSGASGLLTGVSVLLIAGFIIADVRGVLWCLFAGLVAFVGTLAPLFGERK